MTESNVVALGRAKADPHPPVRDVREDSPYVELQVTTNFSFLRGASSPKRLFEAAQILGLPALGVADRNSLAGIVRAHEAAREVGVRLIVGCRLDLTCGTSILVYPEDRAAYARLCRMLSEGKTRAGKGACHLTWEDVEAAAEGMVAILVPAAADAVLTAQLQRLRNAFSDRAHLALTLRRRPGDAMRLHALSAMAHAARVIPVATGDVLYHSPDRRMLQDVVTCIREKCTIDELGFRRERAADRHLKGPAEMARLFARYPEAVAASAAIAARCRFDLTKIKYQYPDEAVIPGWSPQQALTKYVWDGANRCYPDGVPDKVAKQLRHELRLIKRWNYARYFLTVHSIVEFAKGEDILCQGRGSAANSAVCYVLGVTAIDPATSNLLFERFLSSDRNEPPDIDIDFEHERREEVIQWIYKTYGRDRAALTSTVICYRSRGAIREVGKALGLSEDVTALLSSQVSGWDAGGVNGEHAAELNLNLKDPRLLLAIELAHQLLGAPRHLSQHPGGFVLSREPLADLVVIEPAAMKERQVVEWNKDDIDVIRMMKVDILGLGMLGVLRRAFDLITTHIGHQYTIANIEPEDAATYAMIQKADTVGVFQIESRAQMTMLPRLKPATLYDLVIEIAIVRPGPIQGDMVHPYLRRREGLEEPTYPSPNLKQVLKKTLGVPLFQEQAMQIAIVGAKFTPSEADGLRKSMATFKGESDVGKWRDKFIAGMIGNGYTQDFAERMFRQIEGFGSYGFPESHAASFAILAYASSYLKRWHPDAFLAALLNAQPMGFYAPAQLVRDAREHGVEVRPIDVNLSDWDCTMEPVEGGRWGHAVRLGLRMAKGFSENHGTALVEARAAGGRFSDPHALWRRGALPVQALEKLADADAFGSMSLIRRAALWAVRGLRDAPLALFAATDPAAAEAAEPAVALAPMAEGGQVVADYLSHGLSLRAHPLAFLRDTLGERGIAPTATLATARDGRATTVAGLVLVRQKPGSAKGVMFMTLEDETGIGNIVVWPDLYARQRRIIVSATMVAVRGRVQRAGEVVHLVAHELTDLSALLDTLSVRDLKPAKHLELTPPGRGDEFRRGSTPDPRDKARAMHRPRELQPGSVRPGPVRAGKLVRPRDFR